MKKISTLLLLLLLTTASCEKDDICPESTPTTPKLILRFYDISNQYDTKNVTSIGVTSLDENGETFVLAGFNGVTTDSISLPLRIQTTAENFTRFTFYKDFALDDNGTPNDPSDDIFSGNPDVITFTYKREDIYVSRACGFKTFFSELIVTVESDGENWIINPLILNRTIENEISAHVKILH
jgi:hypothetical protein